MKSGKVVGRVTDRNGRPVGTFNSNPLLDTRVYEVEFPDGSVNQYSANIIAESIYLECDNEGRRSQMLDRIIECRKGPDAINIGEEYFTSRNGRKSRIKTTKGWSFLVRWIDGQESWIPLKDIKESYPIDVAEHVMKYGLVEEPAFKWWVPYVIKKRDQIVSAIKARMTKKTHKFGIEVPTTVAEAL